MSRIRSPIGVGPMSKVNTPPNRRKHCLGCGSCSARLLHCAMTVRLSMAGFRSSLPFSALIRQIEHEMETVVKVLQPGPLGIIEHKFSADEIRKANDTVSKAVINWRRNATLEDNNHILKDYIHK